jgi:hypothetical protein
MPICEVNSPINKPGGKGTPLTGADPARRGVKHTSVYGAPYGDRDRTTRMGPGPDRPAAHEANPFPPARAR